MTTKEYIKLAVRTESTNECSVVTRLDHAAYGLSTESAELLDIMKKYFFYGKAIDLVNYKEELGDTLWYIAIACDALGCTPEDLMITNIEKLKVRYPDMFTSEKALKRDLKKERKALT